jgi:poly-gamma-glutamate capsule biosynthesis protein CapA/YwtB (metallophosphatase superfamily)
VPRRHLPAAVLLLAACGAAAPAGAAEARAAPAARVAAPDAVAPGGRLAIRARGLARPFRVQERRGGAWVDRGPLVYRAGAPARFRAPAAPGRLRLRARGADGSATASAYVRVRPLTLAAVGDINLGDGPGAAIDQYGAAYPWASVGPRLRAADLAFGNLECAVSTRGVQQAKTFTFRGRPSSLRAVARSGGLDVLNLANNHSGDYGTTALLDTLRGVRANGMLPVGAGANESQAYRPVVVERLGLRVAFVGFETIEPFAFRAVGSRPGNAWGFPDRVRRSVKAAAAQADVVIATFHWGIERDVVESAQQRDLAATAIAAGATAVIGAHPHVLQPIRRPRAGRLIAYSLGNFVFSANSPGTERTGILTLKLGAGAVLGDRFTPATISGSRPVVG